VTEVIPQAVYQSVVMALLVIGIVPALIFLSQHRPRQWKRLVAWDASGLVIVAALWYFRSIVLIILRWPGSPPHGWFDATFSVLMLVVIDSLLIVRLVSYRAFVDHNSTTLPLDRQK
jgi:thiamine transporter ThiT